MGIEIDNVLDIVFDNSFRFQPSFYNYDVLFHPLVKGVNLNEFVKIFNEATGTVIQKKIYDELCRSRSHPSDIIGLLLLKKYEKNVFITIFQSQCVIQFSQRTIK